ncbi:MAG TPA: transglycosylase SLT domain-containing protein, partial [Candidatus Dormibacteraeota bacterium]
GRLPAPSLAQLSHLVALALGVLLVVPALGTRPAVAPAATTHSTGDVLWSSPVRSRNAPEFAEVFKSSTPVASPAAPSPEPVSAPAPVHRPLRPTATPAPTPKPAPVPPPGSGGSGLAAIYAVFGNSPGLSWALRVANCESHYNPLAVNRSSGASGLFQFMPATWNANFPGQNIWDPMAQAHGALVFYNAGRQSAWTCK